MFYIMRVLILSTYPEGGAGGAAYRLHKTLGRHGVNSKLLLRKAQQPQIYDGDVVTVANNKWTKKIARWSRKFDRLPLKYYNKRNGYFSLNWMPDLRRSVRSYIERFDPDVINLHWILDGFVRLETLPFFGRPLVWTLHDMWAFTGGCVYSQGCLHYTGACGQCPQLSSSNSQDLSRWVWKRKARVLKNLDLTVVTPSSWLAQAAKRSSLLSDKRIEVIPNGIDTNRFKPTEKRAARQALGLPLNRQLVLFGAVQAAANYRKGFHLLQPALQMLNNKTSSAPMEAVIFGTSRPSHLPNLGLPVRYMGRLSDKATIARLYSAADVFVAPSVEDNLPTTVIEALSCGTPVTAFRIGGMPDMITHKENGYLAKPFAPKGLADGIHWCLASGHLTKLSAQARHKAVSSFTLQQQAQRYTELYQESRGQQAN